MATRFGLTWWGRRWIGSLEALGAAYANRLPRGRTYARRGAVRRLELGPGEVTARVDGSRAVPYRVAVRLPVFVDAEWDAVVAALAGQVRHSAALLDGRMPDDIDETLAACGLSLFPHAGELATTCSCPDHANPCKHVAAVHYVLAQTFDGDPFLLPALRGRDREALLTALRTARTGDPSPSASPGGRRPGSGTGVPLRELHASRLYEARGDLSAIPVHPDPPTDPGAPLRRLGPPPIGDEATVGSLLSVVARAADRAWRQAVGDEGRPDDGDGGTSAVGAGRGARDRSVGDAAATEVLDELRRRARPLAGRARARPKRPRASRPR